MFEVYLVEEKKTATQRKYPLSAPMLLDYFCDLMTDIYQYTKEKFPKLAEATTWPPSRTYASSFQKSKTQKQVNCVQVLTNLETALFLFYFDAKCP